MRFELMFPAPKCVRKIADKALYRLTSIRRPYR